MMPSRTTVHYRTVRAGGQRTVGWEPLVVNLPAPMPGHRWFVTDAAAIGLFAVNGLALPGGSPATGWFFVGESVVSESLADAQAGMNFDARGMPLEMICDQMPLANGFAFVCNAIIRRPCVINPGECLRFIATLNPGTPQPGPGVGSYCIASIQISEERFV